MANQIKSNQIKSSIIQTKSLTTGNDIHKGTGLAETLNGLTGNDSILGFAGNDTIIGAEGNDTLNGGQGNDSLLGGIGLDKLIGDAGNDVLAGNDDNDILDGGTGNDTLDGGLGADSLTGGTGNDFYFVDNSNDKVIESTKSTGGKDTVSTNLEFSIATLAGVENIILTGNEDLNTSGNALANQLSGNDGNNNLNGNAGNDTLIGGVGDDTLNGGTGLDKLIGGDGADTYQINNKEDTIIENATDEGDDSIEASLSFILPSNIENLVLLGTTDLAGTGNNQDNTLEGNAGNNSLTGGAGDDSLLGNSGNDTLNGGTGNNTLDGGEGDDNAVFAEEQSNYMLTEDTNDGIITLTVQNINDDSITQIRNVETLVFADHELNISQGLSQELSLSIADISIIEGNTGNKNASFVLTLSEATNTPFDLSYTTLDGDAIAGEDYQATSGTVSFAAGELSKTISVAVLGDSLVETNEQFFLNISAPETISLDNTEASATITNDDKPLLSISATSLLEGNTDKTNASLTISLSAASSLPVTVNFATSNGTALANKDYLSVNNVITFAPGEISKTITVPVLGDTLVESNETFRASLSSPTNASLSTTASTLVTITDDDVIVLPTLSIVGATIEEGNAGSTQATLTVSLSSAASKVVSVNYSTKNGTAISGSDYTASSGTLSFAVGETSKTFTIPVIGDTTLEANESFTVSLSSPSNATLGTATDAQVMLSNDDVPSIALANVSVAEGDTGSNNKANLTVTLSAASTQDISVSYTTADGTANNGSDYSATVGSMVFAAGETSKTLSIPVLGDADVEPDETFTVALSSPSNATLSSNATATVSITNDDKETAFDGFDMSLSEDKNTFTATEVNDRIYALGGGDVIAGMAGDDYLDGGNDDDTLEGGDGKDSLIGGDGDDYLYDHNRVTSGDSAADYLDGGAGDDHLYGLDSTDTLIGGAGNDTLSGQSEFMEGGSGDDSISCDYRGNKSVITLNGDEGNDTITFYRNSNETTSCILNGDAGNDTLYGGYENDTLNGGEGNDYLEDIWYWGGGGNNILNGDAGNDTLSGGDENDTLNGGEGNDYLSGGDPDGRDGNNILNGDAGNDTLSGGSENDTLSGGLGKDTLTGDGGTDKFIFSTNDSGVGKELRDIITDLSLTAKDVIDLSDCSTNVLAFQGTKAFTAIDQVKYSFDFTLNATLVELNLDSNLATSEMQIELTGLLALTTTNFVL